MLSAEFFIGNRARLVGLLEGDGIAVITANGLMQRSGDSAFKFRQENNFFYLTGIEEPNIVLVIDAKNGDEFLILPQQTEVERFFGGGINRDEIAKISGVMTICSHVDGWNRFKKLQLGRKKIYTIPSLPTQLVRQERLFTSPARKLLIQKLKRLSALPHEPLHEQLIKLRMIKQPAEIKAIQGAVDITRAGIDQVRAKMAAGMYEYELEAELDYAFKRAASRHGFLPPIMAAGKNTTILHYQANRARLKKDDILLMDIGAEVANYSADISRTYKVVGAFTEREQAVYDSVMSVHQATMKMLRPGLHWRELAVNVDTLMGEQLMKLGLISENTRAAVRRYFPHAIGHSLGLDVHDACDYKILQENMVITVEPGIYIPEEGIGIRVEDDVLITQNGAKNLSADIPYA
ncbi:MAG: Xaa-Pro aminopeptidase [Candidatus Saccharimonadales bacterium]